MPVTTKTNRHATYNKQSDTIHGKGKVREVGRHKQGHETRVTE